MKPYRVKVKNCIRENTYKYFLDQSTAHNSWLQLKNIFGNEKILSNFNLRQIETKAILLRFLERDSSITIVEKEQLPIDVKSQIFEVIGFAE